MATAQEVLDALTTAIKSRAEGGSVQSFTIEGRTVTFDSLDALLRARSKFASEALSEQEVAVFLTQFAEG